MPNNVVTAPAPVAEEINRAFDKLKKTRYAATAREGPAADELSLDFKLGETTQTLKFVKGEWRKPGAVEQRIMDKLEI